MSRPLSRLPSRPHGLSAPLSVDRSSRAFLYGQDPGVCCFMWQAWTQWYLGYPDRAVASVMEGVELARQLDHPFSLSYAMNFAARLYLCRRDPAAAEVHARDAIRCAQEHGLTHMLAMGQILHGWSPTFLGAVDPAVRELEEGVTRWRSTGARLMTPYWTSLLAAALDRAGRSMDALGVLGEAAVDAARTDDRQTSQGRVEYQRGPAVPRLGPNLPHPNVPVGLRHVGRE